MYRSIAQVRRFKSWYLGTYRVANTLVIFGSGLSFRTPRKTRGLCDSQWQVVEKILNDKRKRKHSLRTTINAIFSINHTGVQWRSLDSKYPPWETVFYHFTKLKSRDIWEEILDYLVIMERNRQGRESSSSVLAIDSQSVKKVQFINEETGIDGGKNVNGRKRGILRGRPCD